MVAARQLIEKGLEWVDEHVDRAPTYERGRLRDYLPAAADADLDLADANLDEVGWDGTYYSSGRRLEQDQHPDYDRPIVARGMGIDLGVLYRLYKTSPQYRRGVLGVAQFVESALWEVHAGADVAPGAEQLHDVTRGVVADSLLRELVGGWRQFLHEAVRGLCVAGFAVFQIVDSADGTVRKLAYRRSNTVWQWLLNETETELVAVRFRKAAGGYYVVPAKHLLILSFDRVGLDFEGLAPLRTAAPYIVAKQLAQQLEMASLEKYAMPVIFLETDGDVTEDQRMLSIWDSFSAEDFPVYTGRPGQKATILAPGASMPDYEPIKRYLDEQITLPLSAEGALVGLNQHGSWALADVKDDQTTRFALYVAELIRDALQGEDNQRYTGIVKRVVDHTFGGPVGGCYPQLAYTFGEAETPIEDIYKAIELGVVEVTPAVRRHVMDRLGLPAEEVDE